MVEWVWCSYIPNTIQDEEALNIYAAKWKDCADKCYYGSGPNFLERKLYTTISTYYIISELIIWHQKLITQGKNFMEYEMLVLLKN